MKLKAALILVAALAGSTASYALADGGHDKGKSDVAKACRPSVELELAGTVAAAPSGGALAVLVTKGGAQGQQLNGKQLTLDVSQAKVRGTLAQNAAVKVHARACVDLVALTVKLVATEVKAGGDKSKDGDTDHHGTSSSSSSSTTTTTTASPTTAK